MITSRFNELKHELMKEADSANIPLIISYTDPGIEHTQMTKAVNSYCIQSCILDLKHLDKDSQEA